MAILGGQQPTTEQQFKEWLRSIDRDGDGRISQQELREALQAMGKHCTRWKAWLAMNNADLNRNNFIDGDSEFQELMSYAARWGIVISGAGGGRNR